MKWLAKWNVISKVAFKWMELADLLEIDHNVTAAIHNKNHGDPELACREVITRWLDGEGTEPTWEELIDNLPLPLFADELRAKLTP